MIRKKERQNIIASEEKNSDLSYPCLHYFKEQGCIILVNGFFDPPKTCISVFNDVLPYQLLSKNDV